MTQEHHTDNNAISKSGLDKIEISPQDYWWHYLRPDRDPYTPDDKTIFDDALRSAILDPKEFARKYVRLPDLNLRTNYGKAEFEAITKAADFASQIVLPGSKYDTILEMRNVASEHPTTKLLFSNGMVGLPDRFKQPDTGATVKFRAHWIYGDSMIINLTSTPDASVSNFQKEAWNFKHHKKAALQMDGVGVEYFAFVNIEQKPPYKIGFHYLDDRSVNFGRATYIKNCDTYVKCLESGIWNGLPEEITPTGLPDWAYKNY